MNPIYKPKGKAKEYGEYAINIYTGCPHGCYYCFAPSVTKKDKETFHSCVEVRPDIISALKRQLDSGSYADKLIHLCFTCDPYPTGCDDTCTRTVINLLKEYGCNVQILTKGNGSRDFDLLGKDDWYGVSLDGMPGGVYPPSRRLADLHTAKQLGINTWVSFEPVVDGNAVLNYIERFHELFDMVKIGKLNYYPSDIDWKDFGNSAAELCEMYGLNYYIKDSLRAEMEK